MNRLTRGLLALALLLGPTGALMPGTASAAGGPGTNFAYGDPMSDSRTEWFRDNARFGMFIHFGPTSYFGSAYNGCSSDWLWRDCNVPDDVYAAGAANFNPSQWDAKRIVANAKAAGMKYIVFTTKHHDGFAMWDTDVNDWNLRDHSGFQRDIIEELEQETKAAGMKLGLYYSIWDWYDPDYTNNINAYLSRAKTQVSELMTRYAPDLLWFDGSSDALTNPNANYTLRETEEFQAEIRALAPNVVINDRIGKRMPMGGDYYTYEDTVPAAVPTNRLQEACGTISNRWFWSPNDTGTKPISTLVRNLVTNSAYNTNDLLNVGPRPDGTLVPVQ
ncbi:alpha-L-fucosidase, partial [Streptomyces sp. BE303]|uniref:alpha-L-fucosidase n=1 Tax=Streptomyces sp. BE303 TaxID=3002528 RepID=UPI002E780D31